MPPAPSSTHQRVAAFERLRELTGKSAHVGGQIIPPRTTASDGGLGGIVLNQRRCRHARTPARDHSALTPPRARAAHAAAGLALRHTSQRACEHGGSLALAAGCEAERPSPPARRRKAVEPGAQAKAMRALLQALSLVRTAAAASATPAPSTRRLVDDCFEGGQQIALPQGLFEQPEDVADASGIDLGLVYPPQRAHVFEILSAGRPVLW